MWACQFALICGGGWHQPFVVESAGVVHVAEVSGKQACVARDPPFPRASYHSSPCALSVCSSTLQDQTDYIDLNLGCPQRIAKRGYYGAFLMDNQPLVQQLVSAAATRLKTPVSVKIRLFPELQTTIQYAQMLQNAGASLLAIHGRTRDMKVRIHGSPMNQYLAGCTRFKLCFRLTKLKRQGGGQGAGASLLAIHGQTRDMKIRTRGSMC